MAANAMMNLLRKMQRDLSEQNDYIKNLHVVHRNINEKFNIMAEKFDQQQATMEKLEQQVRKNNTLLFGNDESQVNFENETTAPYVPHPGGKDDLEPSEKFQNNQTTLITKEALLEEMEWNGANDNNKNDAPKKVDREDNVQFTNEMKEIKGLITEFIKTARSVEKTGPLCDEDADLKELMSEMYKIKELIKEVGTPRPVNNQDPTSYSTEQINQELMSEMYEIKELIKEVCTPRPVNNQDPTSYSTEQINQELMSEMYEIKELIKEVGTPRPINNQDPTSYSTEQINQINTDLKQIMSEINDLKELIGQFDAKKTSVDETATRPSRVHAIETVQISPTYFSAEQIRKLNDELKQVMEEYQARDILPMIEVVSSISPSDEHPVMKALSAGVFFEAKNNTSAKYTERCGIRLGTKGFKRSEIQDLLTDYPDLTLYDVVRERLRSINEWNELSKIYDFSSEYSTSKRMWCMETIQISPTHFDVRFKI